MANPTKSAILRRAASGIGASGGSRFTKWFYGYASSVAWCAIFVCWILIGGGFRFSKNASAWGLGSQLSGLRGWTRVSASNINSGDVVVYNFSHVGLCKARLSNGGKRVFEGNHGNRSAIVDRPVSSIHYGVRPPYSPETVSTPSPPPVGERHTAYIVHGTSQHAPGRLTDARGWEDRIPAPKVGSIVYPAPELGVDWPDCSGNVWTPIKWSANAGWYRSDYLQWAN